MKRVLVLGAGGFVGRRVVGALGNSGWAQPVAGLHRARPRLAPGVSAVTVEATDRASMRRALSGVELVVNCVAGGPTTIADGARCLFDSAAEVGTIERIVHLSSMAVYGSATGRVAETSPVQGDIGWYSQAKVQAEERARAYARAGRRVVILRPGCIYGPESEPWTDRIGRWLRAGRLGDLGAGGDGICNLVLIDDVVGAVIAALRRPGVDGEAINLAEPSGETWNGYFVRFARATGSTPVRRISRRWLQVETKLVAPALKAAGIAARRLGPRLRLPEPMPPSLLRLWQQDIQLDSKKAEQLLELEWTPLAQGLDVSARWFNAVHPPPRPSS